MNQEAQALADEIKRLARMLQAAAFNNGYEDAHPSNAWTRQEKTAKVSADKLAEVLQAIDRLAAMVQPQRQPIETAPRDATAVLVMRDIWPGTESGHADACNGHNTYVAQWWGGEKKGRGAWVCYMDAVEDPYCPIEPTHWMPLPAAPKPEDTK